MPGSGREPNGSLREAAVAGTITDLALFCSQASQLNGPATETGSLVAPSRGSARSAN